MKLSQSSVQKHAPSLQTYIKQIAPVLFQCFLKALEKHFDNLFESSFVEEVYCQLWYGCYIQAVIVFQWFFLQLTQRASSYYFRRIYLMRFLLHIFCCHKLFSFKTFCACDDTFLVPSESHDNRMERQG